MEYTHGLRATILRPAGLTQRDSSDVHRISGDPVIDVVFIVGPGVPQTYRVWDDAPTVMLKQSVPGYVVARPSEPLPEGRNGWMASGAYLVADGCYTDWRRFFGHSLPIPLLDRAERPLPSL